MNCEAPSRRRLRKLQGDRCYLCAQRLAWPLPACTPHRRRLNREALPTLDHVRPKSRGHGLAWNKLLAHQACNQAKGDREPFACELLFLAAINEMARAA